MKHLKLNLTHFSALALTLTLAACSGSGDSQLGSSTTSDMNQNPDNSATVIPVGGSDGLSASTIDENAYGNTGAEATSGVIDSTAIELQNVFYFEYDRSTLTQETRDALDVQASILAQTGESIVLEGFTDNRGTREYNMALGERRAKAVASYLKIRGVPAANIEVISFGEEKPVAEGNNPTAWAQNRRVELK